ncbi:MAG: agmatine deiminase family protein [Saprospiraceae bacterium]|nr:agmatine deiminase family protein [Saprospiraceae bacterium]
MRILRSTLTSLLFTLCLLPLVAQEKQLPHGMTPAEEKIMAEYLRQKQQSSLRIIPTPPPAPVRNMAEWEEVQALVIAWIGQPTILKEIVRNSVKECKVFIVTTDTVNVASQLTTAGIALDSVRFVNSAFNSIWICDYGPSCVYKNDVDSLWIVDWTYNRPRPQDDQVPGAIADYLNFPIYEATTAPYDWVHTGGNHLQTGTGTLFSSNLVLNENPAKTEAEIDTIAKLFLGINQYVKFPTLPFDGIHHLDMHMRVIDEETIVFGQYPEGVADGPQIEANIQYLQDSIKTSFGNPFKIIRMPMPPDQNGRYPDNGGNYRTYTNAVFVNKTLLVPTYQEKYDTTALRIYRENLPGYNVVGINCNNIIGQLGALHCITKLVGASEPLLISHSRLRDVEDTIAYYPVSAYIRHRDGIKEANLFYRSSTDSSYSETPMMLVDSAANIWASIIPSYPAGTEVQYYIAADANDGKHQVRPIVAPEGYFSFKVLGDPANQPPTVKIITPVDDSVFDIAEGHTPFTIEATDPDGQIVSVKVIINFEEVASFDTLPYTFDWTFPWPGTYYAQAQAKDNDGAIVFSTLTKITVEESTATHNASTTSGLSIFPNPVEDILHLKWDNAAKQNISIRLFNSLGQLQTISLIKEENQFAIDVTSLPTGVYVLKVKDGESVYGYEVIKK